MFEYCTNTVGTAFMLSAEKAEKQDSMNAVRTNAIFLGKNLKKA